MPDEVEPVVDVAQVNEVSDKTESSEPSEAAETKVETEAETPKPGTPDKALQKMQQDLGNVTRQIAALTEKKSQGELTEADKAKLEKSTQRLETIRAKAQDFGLAVDGGTELAEHVLELTETVGKQSSLEDQLRQANERLARLENDRNWQVVRTKFVGLDVDAIWDKANADATDALGEDATPRAVNRIASKYFEERCEAAMKRKGEPDPKKGKPATPPTNYKVGDGQRVAPALSETEELLKEARSLVVEI
jgi:hypothetical protein